MSSSTRQLERLLALIPYLQAHSYIPVAELAAEFDVPKKLISEEILLLTMTGTRARHEEMIDLDWDAFDNGFAHISNADFLGRPLRLTVLEGASLMAALGVLSQLAGSEYQELIDRVSAKIHSALSSANDSGIDIHVSGPRADVNDAVNAALATGRQLRITYATDHSDAASERTIDPSNLTVERGHVYLTAYCHQAENQRIFRLDRVLQAEVLDTPITHEPDDGDLEIFNFGQNGSIATLDVDKQARWIVEPCQTTVISEDRGGTRRVTVHAIDEEWLTRLIMLGGPHIRVVEPNHMAERVRAEAVAALNAYDIS